MDPSESRSSAEQPAAPCSPNVDVFVEFNARGMWEVPFWNVGARAGYGHLHRRNFPAAVTNAPDLSRLGGTLAFSDNADWGRSLWTYTFARDACCLLCARGKHLEVLVLSPAAERSADLCAELEAVLRVPDSDDGMLALSYWTLTSSGPRRSSRRLKVPAWNEISSNYPAELARQLGGQMTAHRPAPGRLLLWHGAPGTGKTTAIRALAHAWRDWATVHYVVDPEEFFGRGAAYMTDVLMDRSPRTEKNDMTMLLVLEDAGELMRPDARQDTGQGLSRLLNLADGILGQDVDALILITTNEPLSRLHPAVSRPGRCLSELEFGPLALDEANRWLSERGSDLRVGRSSSLAELFALLRGDVPRERPTFGFAAAS